jgi:hypothetical protein
VPVSVETVAEGPISVWSSLSGRTRAVDYASSLRADPQTGIAADLIARTGGALSALPASSRAMRRASEKLGEAAIVLKRQGQSTIMARKSSPPPTQEIAGGW